MAIASYSTDLTDFEDFETASTISTELTGYTATAKGEDQDTDFPIQGSQHASAEQRTASTGSLASDYGSNITWTSGDNFFLWGIFLAPAAVNSDANAGIEMAVGSAITAFHRWTVGGNDFGTYPYGGWQNFVVNPEVTTGRTTTGAPGTNYRWCGMLCDVISAISKGSPYGIDVIRYGRGELIVTDGQASAYGTFEAMATANDASTAKWGLFQDIDGSYLWKGLISLGTTATSVDFRDENRDIIVDNTRRVSSDFNKIEINNASSNIAWENISIKARGTVSKGALEMVDNATFTDVNGVFTDMDTFIYDTNYTGTNRTFRRCAQVTQGGGTFTACLFEESTAAVALNVSDLDEISYTDFVSDGTGHAMELTTAHAGNSYTITENTYTGYAATDGSTGNEVIYNNSGGAVTINITGGDTPTIRNGTSATTTLIINPVTTSLKVVDSSASPITGARVLVWVTDSTNYFFEATVTITGSGTTATVAHTAHGMITGDNVIVAGVTNDDTYNGTYSVTVTGVNSYTYTTNETINIGTASGTIKSTFAVIHEVTTGTGIVSDTRSWVNDQNIAGRVRKSSASPFYVTGTFTGIIDSLTGFTTNIQLVSDE